MIGRSLGPYQIIEKLGEGGMGVVYKARDTRLERLVALKVLPAARLGDGEFRARLIQGARSAGRLGLVGHSRHPGNDGGFPQDWLRTGRRRQSRRVRQVDNRDNFRCFWGQRLNPITKDPVGEAFSVYHSHGAHLSALARARSQVI